MFFGCLVVDFICNASFVQDILGIGEEQFLALSQVERVKLFEPYHSLAGAFKLLSLRALDDMIRACPQPGTGTFNVIIGEVGELQIKPENYDAVFQVASNFNVLEVASPYDWPNRLENYIYDQTQGPCAAIGAAPALIWRRYFSMLNGAEQTRDNQINLLCNIPLGNYVTNGYLKLSEFELDQLCCVTCKAYRDMQVGWHANVLVTHWAHRTESGVLSVKHFPYSQQRINQVFFAALDLAGTNAGVGQDPDTLLLAKSLLSAAYEGTFKAAIAHGKTKVFITLMGCGVFGNCADWVAEVLINCMHPLIIAYGLHVFLVLSNVHDWQKFSA